MNEDFYEPEAKCSWCGAELELDGDSFNTALEAHVQECEVWLEEQLPRG